MSTRCTTHFIYSKNSNGNPEAIIYRHLDGYPNGAGKDLISFLKKCKNLKDSRLSDPSYLAAKYVVFLAKMFAYDYDYKTNKRTKRKNRLDFLSVGVCATDPEDIEYRYVVDCSTMDSNGLPTVKCVNIYESTESVLKS